jgi:hypothetical protein
MNDTLRKPEDFAVLYRRAFADYGARALWNMRAIEDPTPSDALAITRALRTHGGMETHRKCLVVPLTKLQSHVLRLLAAGRSPDSYIAGDIDIFQDTEQRLEAAAQTDSKTLIDAGLKLTWKKIVTGKRDAEVEEPGDRMRLEWAHDSAFRFFPAQRDELFGYVLHPVDLATNKASAAADRREPRDIVDLLTIHRTILPLGAAICAAVGRFPGQSPEEMLADITRHSRFTMEEFRVLATDRPIDVPDLHRRIRRMLDNAESFISCIPSEAVGVVFLEAGKPVQPNVETLDKYQRHAGAVGGVWPSSPEISRAMLERYKKQSGSGGEPEP